MPRLHTTGREWTLKRAFRGVSTSEIYVGLYHTGDDLGDNDDVDDVETVPEGEGYELQKVEIGDNLIVDEYGENVSVTFPDLEFDTEDSEIYIDGYYAIAEFESDIRGDTEPTEHLLFSGELDTEYHLDHITEFVMRNSGTLFG